MNCKIKYIHLQVKRQKKEFKRRRKKVTAKPRNKNFLLSIYKKKIETIRKQGHSVLSDYFNLHFYDETKISHNLEVPKIFCFEHNNKESIEFIKSTFTTLFFYSFTGNININLSFGKCNKLRLGPLMLLNIIIMDFFQWRKKAISRGVNKILLPKLILSDKMSDEINNLLCTMHFPVNVKKTNKIPIFGFKLIEGKVNAKDYLDNSKGKVSKKIRKYINTCIKIYGVELDANGVGLFDNMIGEILANADDHSSIDKWFVYGSFSVNLVSSDALDEEEFNTGELNLIFLNFGDSIYEGFEKTKNLNTQMYNNMDQLYMQVISNHKLERTFSREGMFSLYGLQEGFSRLLHEDKSRGIGTMTFIRSFLQLGYNNQQFESILYILSGKTLIKCNDKFRPFHENNRYYLSLNDNKSLKEPPSKKCLINLEEHFPGTLLMTKLFLNRDHLKSSINE